MPSFCTYFISDLHLQPERPDITRAFREFMQTRAHHADAIYILGDLFEAWIGDDDDSGFNQSIYNEINYVVQQGTPVYFMRGNRDFLIGKRFAEKTGVTLLDDPTVVTVYDQHYLLCHGDSLCTLDTKHQRFRKIMHSKSIKRIAAITPLSLRRKVAGMLREKSTKHNKNTAENILDVHQDAVETIMRQHKVTQLIHGHTHRPDTHTFEVDGKTFTRKVLGCWDDGINYIKLSKA
ncbi:MAG: UDP-2,3-diacylglucosamine diphosphatase [Gammaproteobacteria bacterium]|nr:UDP-2,3-diacylglucosamine diphosphatase [Gammaproteobacteria bacterium]MCH9743555.1 UDP-2,3-diacylglucosamine diphosphatase [Gammaproteobacteria bacterium]